jgi:hypothetical protein
MNNLHGFPFFEMEFKKDGTLAATVTSEELLRGILNNDITDVVIISHGWNNDMKEALCMYDKIFSHVAEAFKEKNISRGKYAVLGIYWPSKKFADNELIPGGAAGTGNDGEWNYLSDLKDFFDADDANGQLDTLISLLQRDADSPGMPDDQISNALDNLLSPLLDQEANELLKDDGTAMTNYTIKDIVMALENTDNEKVPSGELGGAAQIGFTQPLMDTGGAMGLSSFFGGAKEGVRNMFNLLTYYQMKNRAGIVGSTGLNGILKEIQAKKQSVRLHLIGHSFGARLVTSAVAGQDKGSSHTINSLILLQAAFSHFAFAKGYQGNKDGIFRRIVENGNIKGPIVISHTRNDNAVGIAYALASRVARQAGAALGDENDFYGGLGSNGAQKTPEAINTFALEDDMTYSFGDNKIYNLRADNTIGGHSLITNRAVGDLIADVITKKN